MLSVFPELLFLSPFSAFLIRLAVASVFAYSAWQHFKRTDTPSRVIAVPEIGVAVAIIMGAWAQPAALLGAVIASIWLMQPTSRTLSLGTILLSLVMCLSLLVTGAGAFAFDLPL